jgi:hypothetical protein
VADETIRRIHGLLSHSHLNHSYGPRKLSHGTNRTNHDLLRGQQTRPIWLTLPIWTIPPPIAWASEKISAIRRYYCSHLHGLRSNRLRCRVELLSSDWHASPHFYRHLCLHFFPHSGWSAETHCSSLRFQFSHRRPRGRFQRT